MSEPTVYVFDLFGTLVDYASLAQRCSAFVPDPATFVTAWRAKQISYSFAASLMDRYVDFDTITACAFDYAVALHAIDLRGDDRTAAIEAWTSLPAYADARAAVAAVRSRGTKTAILSNGTPHAIARTLANANLEGLFDATISVDEVRAYKPHPSVYALVTARFATTPERVVFVSSNGWDATGAAEFGFDVRWCNRAKMPAETFGRKPQRTIASLADLV